MSDKAKRQPMKPIKAWAVESWEPGVLGHGWHIGRLDAELYQTKAWAKGAARNKLRRDGGRCRVVRVEIHEVSR